MKEESGKSIVKGIAIGIPYIIHQNNFNMELCRKIDKNDTKIELNKLSIAIDEVRKEIKEIRDNLKKKFKNNEIEILTVHLMLLEDPMYLKEIEKGITRNFIGVECSIKKATERFIKLFEKIEDPIYKQRALDIRDVSERLINHLVDRNSFTDNLKDKILIIDDLMPSELLKMHENNNLPKGIIMEYAGETSHVAILVRSLDIPTIMGRKEIFNVDWGEEIIIDTTEEKAKVIINPSKKILVDYKEKNKNFNTLRKKIEENTTLPTITKDGVEVFLHINIDGNIEEDMYVNKNPNGVGLLRTEMLYMNSSNFPSETDEFEFYKKISKSVNGKSVIIRTLDIGADKQLPYYSISKEENPSLGIRGLRFSLQNLNIFKSQLRAILKASADNHNIKIMFPMVTTLVEIKEAKKLISLVKKELKEERINFNDDIEIGIMVEVPSIIFIADTLSKEVDFFSVGTNDLTQYILATDRFNNSIENLYDQYNPAVIRAINTLLENLKGKEKKISVCGEMAGEEIGAIILLALGINDLSVSPAVLLEIRNLIRKIEISKLKKIKKTILLAQDSEEIKKIVKKFIEKLGE
jgi:phosphotransferase system enzyme I (PtsI)